MRHLKPIFTIILCLSSYISYCQPYGNLDPLFGSGGIVITPFLGDNDGEDVAIQADGKIVLVGTSNDGSSPNVRVIRYLYDGSVDNSFGTAGTIEIIGLISEGRSVVIQPDGKILVSGSSFAGPNAHAFIARLNIDGTMDTSFGTNGIVETFIGTSANLATGLALQDDGKIVLGGSAFIGVSADFAIVRYEADGSLDNSFGSAGVTTFGASNLDELSEFVLIQDDGKIVIGGTSYNASFGDIMVARVNVDGTLDNSFGTNGMVVTDIVLGNDTGTSGALQSDGKILVIGDAEINSGPLSDIDFCTIRYNSDGTLDNTFGGGGYITGDLDGGVDIGTSIAIQQNGSIVVAGDGIINPTTDSTSQFGMFRYLENGTLDPSFGTNGKVITDIGSIHDLCNAMTIQSDTLILLVGESDNATGNSDFALARYSNGTIGITEFQLEANDLSVYPNPIGSNSVLTYSLKQNDRVSIELYDLNGALVNSILDDENQSKGVKSVNLNLKSDLPHGIYTIRVKSSASMRSIEIYK